MIVQFKSKAELLLERQEQAMKVLVQNMCEWQYMKEGHTNHDYPPSEPEYQWWEEKAAELKVRANESH